MIIKADLNCSFWDCFSNNELYKDDQLYMFLTELNEFLFQELFCYDTLHEMAKRQMLDFNVLLSTYCCSDILL